MPRHRSKCKLGEGCRKAEGGTECTEPDCTRIMRGSNRKCSLGAFEAAFLIVLLLLFLHC